MSTEHPPGRIARWSWLALLTLGLGAFALGLAGPEDLRPWCSQVTGWVATVAGVTAIWREPRQRRLPWLMFAVAAVLALTAGVLDVALTGSDDVRPMPGAPEVMLVVAYGCLIYGSFKLRRLRHPSSDPAGLIDGLILAVALATVVGSFGIADYLRDDTQPLAERLTNAGFSALALLLLATVVRLALGPGARTTSYRLLAVAVGAFLVADIATTMSMASDGNDPAVILAPLIFGCWGAAALHPDRRRLTESSDLPARVLGPGRLVLIATVLLIGPAILVGQWVADEPLEVAVTMAGEVLLSVLVLARLGLMVRDSARVASHEHELRQATAEFTRATTETEMVDIALRAVQALAPGAEALRASAGLDDGSGRLRVIASEGHQAAKAVQASFHPTDLPPQFIEALEQGLPAWERAVPTPDLGPHPDARDRAVGVLPLASQTGLRGVIVVSSARPLDRATQRAVEALAGTVALALEGAALAAELHRARSERQLRALVRHSSDLVLVIGEDGRLTFVSPASERLLGRPPAELLGRDPLELVHVEDRPLATNVLQRPGGGAWGLGSLEARIERRDGSWRWFEIIAHDLTQEEEIRGIVVNCRDVSDRREAEQRVLRSEARFRALVQNVTDVVAVVDAQGRFTYVSPAVTPLLGYRPDDLVGSRALDLLTPDQVDETSNLFAPSSDGTLDPMGFEVRLLAASGEWRTLDVTATDLRDDPAVGGLVLNARDVTFRKELEQSLRHQAMHDALTGLANRTRFAEEVAELGTRPGRGSANVLLIDLDDFKTLNDGLGHDVGDELLVGVAERLLRTLPSSCTVARLGGDEFAVAATTDEEVGPFGLALRILNDLRRPFRIRGREMVVTASIGIAPLGDQPTNPELVLRNADMAMYLAKERGKDRVEMFDERMHTSVTDRLELRSDLTRAVEEGQLRLVYQPVIDLRTGRVRGVEALVRWVHPQRGLLAPDAFIPIAEQSGLIVALGHWVLREACQQLRVWQLSAPADMDLSMSVNLSVRQLEREAIVDEVRAVVEEHGLDPTSLTLEITETAVVADTALTSRRLAELKAIGVGLAIDDFGTGYSSLSYVEQFPIDVIKIDRSFVAGVRLGRPTPVLQSMVDLSRRLGVALVAEGIERRDQLEALTTLGCDLGQGYLFAAPVGATELGELISANLEGSHPFFHIP